MGFYRDGGPTEVKLNDALFPLLTSTAPMQLRLEQFVALTPAAAAAEKAAKTDAMRQTATEDEPTQANLATGRSKKKKKAG